MTMVEAGLGVSVLAEFVLHCKLPPSTAAYTAADFTDDCHWVQGQKQSAHCQQVLHHVFDGKHLRSALTGIRVFLSPKRKYIGKRNVL